MSTSTSPAAAGAPDSMFGVSLEQYAGVTVALDEGFALDVILAREGIANAAWKKAERAWKVRIAKGGAEGPLAVELRAKRAVAEDCLAREVAPIDADLGAWLSFLRTWRESAAPFEILRGAGLGLNDLARLQRGWTRRMEADEALRKQAAELAPRAAAAPPPLRVAPPALAPFPWSPRSPGIHAPASEQRALSAPSVSPSPLDTSLSPGSLRLFAYVAIKARLAESPGRESAVLDQLAVRDFAATDAAWQAKLREDPALARDYRRLLDAQRAKLRAGLSGGSAAAPPPTPIAAPPPAIPMPPPAPPPAPPKPAAAPKLAGTAIALDPPRAALPFVADAAPGDPQGARPSPPREPKGAPLAGTSIALDPPRGPSLPFVGAPAPAPPPRPPLAGTSLALDVPAKPVLPFAASAPPRLTLEQHASLLCELAEAPQRAAEILARYGLTVEQKAAADEEVRERFAREPGARAAWESAYQTYRAYLVSQRLTR